MNRRQEWSSTLAAVADDEVGVTWEVHDRPACSENRREEELQVDQPRAGGAVGSAEVGAVLPQFG